MTTPTITELENIAHRLTDTRVTVRRRAPAIADAIGQVCRAPDGSLFIDMAPHLEGRKLARVFLHECAHLKRGHIQTTFDGAHAAPGSYGMQAVHHGNVKMYERQEREANELADEWEAWIDAHGGDLGSLAHWLPPELQRMIDDAATKAAARVVAQVELRKAR